jgi:hydrogenase expression/formation protein HypC
MCVGVPMRVISSEDGMAECEGRGRRERLNAMLLGDLPPGTWILAYQGSAVRSMSEDEAQQTTQALDALEAAMSGSGDIDSFFSDLIGREPSLPPHLKDSKA